MIIGLLGLGACASAPQSTLLLQNGAAAPFVKPVVLPDIPFFPQKEFQCGPAALATILKFANIPVIPDELVSQVYLPARQGSLRIEMQATTRRYGRIAYVLPPILTSIIKEVQQGRPVLVMQNLGLQWYPRWHYAVVVGYDISRAELFLNSGRIERYRMSLRLFERTWQRADHWAMIALVPGELSIDAEELPYAEALNDLAKTHSIRESEIEAIEAAYIAGVKHWPDSIPLAMGLGNVFYVQGRKQAAANQFTEVIGQDPTFAPAHNNLAQVLLETGNQEDALAHAQMAVRLGGDHFKVYQRTLDAVSAEKSPAPKHQSAPCC